MDGDLPSTLGYLFVRYLHIVCTTLLVGGTLFYEMVMPAAIDDLKTEQQLAVFARARWMFRWIVRMSAVVLLVTGVFATIQYWDMYTLKVEDATLSSRAGWWWAAHSASGLCAILISVMLTTGRTPPAHPVGWMRLNLVVLMIVIFLASAGRHVRLSKAVEQAEVPPRPVVFQHDDEEPATQPAAPTP
jgi:uncharacterized membrane protein